jgi:hypothetical protein
MRFEASARSLGERHVERLGHPGGDLALHPEDVGHRRVERLRPLRRRARRDDELRADLHAPRAGGVLHEPHGAGQQVLDVELLADLLRRLRRLAVAVRARAGDDLETAEPGQLAAHLVGDAVGEVVVVRAAEVLEREDGHALDAGVDRRGRR